MTDNNIDHLNSQIAIVGAGVIGLACAYYLLEEGYSVTIIDQGSIGAACSYGNCGYVCPSHVLPLTEPGIVLEGLKSLLNPKSAFRIKPQLRVSFYYWLWQLARRCNHQQMMKSATHLKSILDFSRNQYDLLFKNQSLNAQWKEDGLLYVLKTQKGIDDFAKTDKLLTESFDTQANFINTEQLTQFEPSLKSGLAGAFFYPDDASLKPDQLTSSLAASLKQAGVTFIENCDLKGIYKRGAAIEYLETSHGLITAEQFVFATGAWSRSLGKELGCKIPVEPAKGYSVTIERPGNCPKKSILFPEHRVGITPFDDCLRLGSMMEFAGFNKTIPQHRIKQLFDSAKPYLKTALTESYEQSWMGWRPMTWDSLPIIGYAPSLDNVILATGHNMLGMTLAPATGKLVAEMMVGKNTSINVEEFSPQRF